MARPARIETVPIPQDLRALLLARLGERQLAAWGAEAMIVEAVREHIISRNKAATLLGVEAYDAREAFFARHQLHNEYTLDMLDKDFKTIKSRR